MQKQIVILSLAIASLTFSACEKSIFGINGKGDPVHQSRDISGFKGIESCIAADVQIIQDSIYSVDIEAQQNVLDVLETEIQGDRLVISFGRHNVYSYEPIHIQIHMPYLNEITVSGSGNISSSGTFVGDAIELRISGSGNIYASSLQMQSIDADINGSGNIEAAGSAVKSNLVISGSGDIRMFDLVTEDVLARINGSGNIECTANQRLDAEINGSGNIRYKGDPDIEVHINGSGDLIKEF